MNEVICNFKLSCKLLQYVYVHSAVIHQIVRKVTSETRLTDQNLFFFFKVNPFLHSKFNVKLLYESKRI